MLPAVRIAYVAAQCPPHGIGGIGTYNQIVARHMAAAGHDVTVISAAPGQRRASSIEEGVRVERFGAAGPELLWRLLARRAPVLTRRLRPAVSAALAVRRVGQRYDVLEVPEWKAEGLLLGLVRRGPVVVHLHLAQTLVERWNGRAPARWRLAERLEHRAAVRARQRTATSRMTTTLPDGTQWVDPAGVRVVAPPLRAGTWARCPPVTTTEPVVLSVGRMERRKAPDVLIEAMGLLRAEVPSLRCVFVGEPYTTDDGGPYDQWLMARADELGLTCEIHPPTADDDELLAHYARARVVAVPSRFETLSMVAFEGFACDRPVVMTEAVGAAEWFVDELPECVVANEDPAALAAALRPFLLDPALAAEVGARGRAVVDRVSSPAAVVESRLAVYRSVSPERADPNAEVHKRG